MNRDDQITEVLLSRQKAIVGTLPAFFKVTSTLAILAFLITMLFQLRHDPLMTSGFSKVIEQITRQITVPSIIACVLSLFSSLIIYLFVGWSISFVPFIAYQAHKASRDTPSSIRTKPIRWVQLYAATFFPITVFAIAWDSIGPKLGNGISLKITNPIEALWLCMGTGLVVTIIWLANKFIPSRLAAVRLSFFSLLLYLSLFLSYGFEISIASHSMVFGILLYLMFRSNEFAELARRLSLHDMDATLADHIDGILNRHQEVDNLRSELHLKKREHEVQEETHKLSIQIEKDKSEQNLAGQLANIHKRGLELSEQLNQTQLKFIDDKIHTLSEVFDIVNQEAQNRVKEEIPNKLAELREQVKTMSPEDLRSKMDELSQTIAISLGGIPEALGPLRQQLLIATRQLKEQTKMIADQRANLADEATNDDTSGIAEEQPASAFESPVVPNSSPKKERLRPSTLDNQQ